jgi:hypothetical protein
MYLQKKSTLYLYSKLLFCSKTEKHYTLCSSGPSLGAKLGLPDEFSQKNVPQNTTGNGNVGLGPRDLSKSFLKSAKIRRRRKKSPAKFRQKIKTTFLGHEFFLLFKLKLQYFVQESAAKFVKKSFSKFFFFFTETVADLAVRYTLCGRYTLCAHCRSRETVHLTDPKCKPRLLHARTVRPQLI